MSRKGARWAMLAGLALGFAGLAACEGDDTTPSKVPQGQGAGGGGGADATTGDGSANYDSSVPLGAPLCAKYGADIATKVTASLMTKAGADCRISAHFATPSQGTPHLQQCLQKQLGTFFQCDGATYDKDNAGKNCRTMAQAHQNLNLRNADFDAFIQDSIAAMRENGIADKDIQDVLPTFLGTKTAIVKVQLGIGNSQCTCQDLKGPDGGYCGTDAGIDAGEGGLDGGEGGATDGGTTDAPNNG